MNAVAASGRHAAGRTVVHAEALAVESHDRVELINPTDLMVDWVRRSGVREGLASLWSLHTTCALFLNEAQEALHGISSGAWRRPSRASRTRSTTIRPAPTAIAGMRTHIAGRCSSAMV